MGLKTLIIPDLHLRHRWAEEVIARHPADQVVFLGDYFDNWGDSPHENIEAARWLHGSLKEPNRVHLWGNHDLHYYEPLYRCGGFTNAKHRGIRYNLEPRDWALLRWFVWVDDWLCTHAGLHPHWIPNDLLKSGIGDWLNDQAAQATWAIGSGQRNWMASAYGPARAGGGSSPDPVGGLLWLDWNHEFEVIPSLHQICGHTPGPGARRQMDNWCLDAPGIVAIVDEGHLEVVTT